MLQGLLMLLALPLVIESALRLLWLAKRQPFEPVPSPRLPTDAPSVQILIPAHNEQAIIYDTVSRLVRQTYPSDKCQVILLADNCSDQTAVLARQAGAFAFERHDLAHPGKGNVIRWWLSRSPSQLPEGVFRSPDLIAVFDADSQVEPDFIQHCVAHLLAGTDAVQGFVAPLAEAGSIGVLSGYSELLGQLIDDAGRSALGWSVPLRGTGMLFRTADLRRLTSRCVTQAEDMELSILLAAENATVRFVPQARLLDPKPLSANQGENQRTRWIRGQWQAVHHHPRAVFTALVLRGSGNFALTLSLLLRPKLLYTALKGGLLLSVLANILLAPWMERRPEVQRLHNLAKESSLCRSSRPAMNHWATEQCPIVAQRFIAGKIGSKFIIGGPMGLALTLALLADILYYLAGLWLVEQPQVYRAALRQAPKYALLWLHSLMRQPTKRTVWLSARQGGPKA